MKEKRRIQIQGIVQGVGFRPFVYALATTAGLVGQILNDAAGVTIEVEGETTILDSFTTALQTKAPPLATIDRITTESLPPTHNGHTLHSFTIAPSQQSAEHTAFISPDMAVCDDCLHELFNPHDRRYRYPFINCTNCGPRFTIIKDVPYDRPLTTMAAFKMCATCQAEYEDPHNRRFHAQPNACPVCGPQLSLRLLNSQITASDPHQTDSIAVTQRLLAQGFIVAIKGLGGYHLACDATNTATVQTLRERKHRWDKPFALMAADLETAAAICELSAAEKQLLEDRRRPIVLLKQQQKTAVATAVAPQQKTLGLMLPYTPLHYLLFKDTPCPLLVMTSANRSDEPIVYRDAEVDKRLAGIADAVLTYNRAIHMRCDDSLVRVVSTAFSKQSDEVHQAVKAVFIRRSRGYAPQPMTIGSECHQPVLAVGAHLKNTFCLAKGKHAFLSHHIGDLDNWETLRSFGEGIAHFERLFDIAPQVVAHDLHPDYWSTRYALEQEGITAVAVQHHHAHIASVMAEHKLTKPVIGVAFDGTGYGPDGTIWGGEFLIADLQGFERAAYLRPVALLGGEQAIRQPWRVAAAWLQQLYGDEWPWEPGPGEWGMNKQKAWPILKQMLDKQLNCPLTSSMGRLFDAVAALLGICQQANYEGQAAVELEALADESVTDSYPFFYNWPQLDPAPLMAELLFDLQRAVPLPTIAAKFHNSVAALITAVCLHLRQLYELHQVALSGGVFQNAFLLSRAITHLTEQGFEVFINEQIPPNDGGLALGQLVIANEQLNNEQ